MKKLIVLFAGLLFTLTGLYAQTTGGSERALCGIDTVLYTRFKATNFSTVTMEPGSNIGYTQYFPGSPNLLVYGCKFHAYKVNQFPFDSSLVVAEIYQATTDSLPTGSPLTADTLSVNYFDFLGNLNSVDYVALWQPLTISFPYVIVVRNLTAEDVNLVTNDFPNNDGLDENLGGAMQGANMFVKGDQVTIGGNPYDGDALIYPIINYDLNKPFEMDPRCLDGPGDVEFSSGVGVVDNPIYNRYRYFNQNNQVYDWTFGDGGNGPGLNPTHFYSTTGPFQVTLTTTVQRWAGGTCSATRNQDLNVQPFQDFSIAYDGLEMTLTNKSDPTGWNDIDWTFGDGSYSLIENPIHTYSNPGSYLVCMNLDGVCGLTELCKPIGMTFNPTLNCGLDTLFYTTSKVNSFSQVPLDGEGINQEIRSIGQYFPAPQQISLRGFNFYGWHEGNADTYVDLNCKVYGVIDGGGKIPDVSNEIASVKVKIGSQEGIGTRDENRYAVMFETPLILDEDFFLTVEADSGTVITVLSNNWVTSDGAGEYNAAVEFFTGWANSLAYSLNGSVFNGDAIIEPIVEYNFNANYLLNGDLSDPQFEECINIPGAVSFNNISSSVAESKFYSQWAFDGNAVYSYVWDYGDSTDLDTTQNGGHAYTKDGPFEVTVTTTINGWTTTCQSEQTYGVRVFPRADFEFEKFTSAVQFENTSAHAETIRWTFSDGTESTLENPIHYFPAADWFQVCLDISNECGSDLFCDTLHIKVLNVQNPILNNESVKVYPNPASDNLTFAVDLRQPSDFDVELVDITGRTIWSQRYEQVLTRTEQIDLSGLAKGAYLMRFDSPESTVVRKVTLVD